VIFVVLDVIEQWALTYKTFKVFCSNICCLFTRFYFIVPQWHSHPSFTKWFWSLHPIKPERSRCG